MVRNGESRYTCKASLTARDSNGERERVCACCPLDSACDNEGQVPYVTCPSCGVGMAPVFAKFKNVAGSLRRLLLSLKGKTMTMSDREINGLEGSLRLQKFRCPSCHKSITPEAAVRRLLY